MDDTQAPTPVSPDDMLSPGGDMDNVKDLKDDVDQVWPNAGPVCPDAVDSSVQ